MRVVLRSLRAAWLTVDPRSLGAFRIGLALLLLFDLVHRWVELDHWYTNAGLLPNHTLLWRPPATRVFSLFFVASSREEVSVGFALCAGVYLLLLAGYRTRTMQVLALIARVSVNSRLAVLENGGDMVLNLLCVFTVFLPLGRCFSLDAWLSPQRDRGQQPILSIAVLALIAQFAAIYFFNAVSKNGEAWRDGTAVHYALHQDKYVTALGVLMREQLPVEALRVLTWSVLTTEWLGCVLILNPLRIHHTRALAVVLLPLLHLGFALGLNLGAFSPAMMAFYPLLLTDAHWRWLERRRVVARVRVFALQAAERLARLSPHTLRAQAEAAFVSARRAPARRWLGELAAAAVLLAVTSEALNDNACVPQALRLSQPSWAKALVEYPRLLQGWRMFAPEPPRGDSMIYVDATTAEGKRVDPYNLVASRTRFPAGDVVPVRMDQDQFFTMYSERIAMPGYAAYRQAFLEWLVAHPRRTGRTQDCLISFDVYYVTDRSPAPGGTRSTPLERKSFMSYTAPSDGQCKPLHEPPASGDLRAHL